MVMNVNQEPILLFLHFPISNCCSDKVDGRPDESGGALETAEGLQGVTCQWDSVFLINLFGQRGALCPCRYTHKFPFHLLSCSLWMNNEMIY